MTELETGILTDKEYKEIYSKVPRLCVDLFIVGEEGVLLTRRNIPPFEGLWHFPGGRVRKDETLAEAMARIGKGELGLSFEKEQIGKLMGAIEFMKEGENMHSVSLVFGIQLMTQGVVLDRQASDWGFFKEIPEDTLPYQKEFLVQNASKMLE